MLQFTLAVRLCKKNTKAHCKGELLLVFIVNIKITISQKKAEKKHLPLPSVFCFRTRSGFSELKGNQVKNLNSPAAVNFFYNGHYILLPLKKQKFSGRL